MIMNLLGHNLTHALKTFSLKMGLLSFFTSSSQFNINLDSKSLAPFSLQGPTEKEQIDVQGDIMYDLAEFITDTWKNVRQFFSRVSYSLWLCNILSLSLEGR